jgi:hypothetical protein
MVDPLLKLINGQTLTCCEQLLFNSDDRTREALTISELKTQQLHQYKELKEQMRRYEEQGTVEQCAAALAHCEACDYARDCLPE